MKQLLFSKELQESYDVSVIVRSKGRLLESLEIKEPPESLKITEASLTEMSKDEIQAHVNKADFIVSCLGHTLDMKGLFGRPYYWVSDTARLLVQCTGENDTSNNKKKFIWMGSDGVAHPDDNPRSYSESMILWILRHVINPHKDNELVANFFQNECTPQKGIVEWVIVRPTDLVDGDTTTSYELHEKPPGGLFGSASVRRSNVARFMVDLIQKPSLFTQYKFKMPVVHDKKQEQDN